MGMFDAQIVQNKRARWDIVQRQRDLVAKAEAENRSLTTEERDNFDKMNGTIADHEKRIGDLEKLNADEEAPPADPPAEGRAHRPADVERGDRRSDRRASAEYRSAYRRYLATGEARDMVAGTNAAGGYLLAPIQTSDDVIKQIDDLCFVRPLARRYPLKNAVAVGVRKMTSRVSDSDWTTETGALTPDTALAFGRRDLTPQLLAKLVTVSDKLIASGVDVEPIVSEELAYKNAITEEKAYMTGNGSGKPLGVFVADANGIPTSQDVTSGAAGDFVADDLVKLKYAIKGGYTASKTCRWVMGRPIVAQVRTMKDNNGRYIWQAGLAADKPDTILDVALCMSEYAPVVKTSGSYVAVIGDFRFYAIAELADFYIQRLNERFADINEVGFIARRYVDGAPVQAEAFARLKTQ